MAVTLTATPNPVGIWGDTATRTIPIVWSTGSAVRARLYIKVETPPNVSLNETLFDGDPTTGNRDGTKPLTVKVGSTYTLILRQVSNDAVLGTLFVIVIDLLEESAKQAAASAAFMDRIDPPQAIHNLRIQAGTDTVRVAFKTVQPTVPVIRVLRLDGTEVDGSFPLGAGMQTTHQAVLGLSSPLDQGTEFEVRILASGHNHHGKTVDVKASHRFTTGTRPIRIFFDEIDVWRDGDPGLKGDGEFTFSFGAGDADSRTNLGEPWPSEYKGDINDDDPPKFINKFIDMAMGPRSLWIQVIGTEDDGDVFSGIYYLGRKPHYTGGAGSDWVDTGDEYQVSVTQVFDLGDTVYGSTVPIEMVTGNFGVAFTIRGSIGVQTQPGKSPLIFDLSDSVTAAGGLGKLFANGTSGALPDGQPGGSGGRRPGMLVARAADGATYRRVPDSQHKLRRDQGWTLAAPAAAGPVTALGLGADRMALFAVDAEGAVLYAGAGGRATSAKWRNLGGRFTGAVTAVALASTIELLASDDAGAVFHLTLPAKGGKPDSDWRRIGECRQGEIKPVPLGKDSFALFALGRGGEVMHRIHRDGRWRKEGWQVIPGATGVQLGAGSAGADATGVVLAVIGEDQKLQTLAWRDYPEKKPERWVAQGDFQAWLVRPLKAKPRSRRAEPEPKPNLARAALSSRVGRPLRA